MTQNRDALRAAERALDEADDVVGEAERRQADRRSPDRLGGRRANDPQPQWVSLSVYARIYGLDRATVYRLLRLTGVLDTYTVGSLRRIRNVPPRDLQNKVSPDVAGC